MTEMSETMYRSVAAVAAVDVASAVANVAVCGQIARFSNITTGAQPIRYVCV